MAAREARELSRRVRLRCLDVTAQSAFGHLGPDFSCVDILCCLYSAVLRFPGGDLKHTDRDRFVLSKGHAALALYATLIETGFWAPTILDFYGTTGGLLGGHPSSSIDGIETCTGALGHGLPFGVGAALAAKAQGSGRRTIVLLGDGELQEGSNWEAAMLAGSHGLDALTVIIDRNGLQQGRQTESVNALEPLVDKWCAFGWAVTEINGHDSGAIKAVLTDLPLKSGLPTCVIANTIKGRGVSFMEGRAEWHHRIPTSDEVALARTELSAAV